jgi:hypothetical protein
MSPMTTPSTPTPTSRRASSTWLPSTARDQTSRDLSRQHMSDGKIRKVSRQSQAVLYNPTSQDEDLDTDDPEVDWDADPWTSLRPQMRHGSTAAPATGAAPQFITSAAAPREPRQATQSQRQQTPRINQPEPSGKPVAFDVSRPWPGRAPSAGTRRIPRRTSRGRTCPTAAVTSPAPAAGAGGTLCDLPCWPRSAQCDHRRPWRLYRSPPPTKSAIQLVSVRAVHINV